MNSICPCDVICPRDVICPGNVTCPCDGICPRDVICLLILPPGCWIKSSNDQSQCQQNNCLAKRWHKYDVPRDSFCCCTTDLCNKKENIQVVEEPVEVKEHKKSGTCDYNSSSTRESLYCVVTIAVLPDRVYTVWPLFQMPTKTVTWCS